MKIAQLQLKNNLILAPMAGITDLPYRRIMAEFGAGLVTTEMVSANGLKYGGKGSLDLLRSCAEERPLAVQIFGEDPQVMAEAARTVAPHGDLIDINMGCPVKKVVRSGAGSALMRDPLRVGRIVEAVRAAIDLPLTVKIRSGWDAGSINFLEVARIAVAAGADAVTLHPRTRARGFGGEADWNQIAQLKAALDVPVIGSGDIFEPRDALRMLAETGCDGAMIGRGGYGNPWLIRDILELQQGMEPQPVSAGERLAVTVRHLDYFIEAFGEHRALFHMRKHLCWYSRALPGAAAFRSAVNHTGSLQELRTAMAHFFEQTETCP